MVGLEIAPAACIYLPPNIAGYVGSDHVAVLLATGTWQTERTTVSLDIGTTLKSRSHIEAGCFAAHVLQDQHLRVHISTTECALHPGRLNVSGFITANYISRLLVTFRQSASADRAFWMRLLRCPSPAW